MTEIVTDLKGFIGIAAQGRPLTRAQAALGLVQCSCSGDRMADAPLQRMAGFFTRATVRLAQITAHSAEVSAEDR